MTITNPKLEIVRSLDSLDVNQTEKVLDYIRSLSRRHAECPEDKRKVAKVGAQVRVSARLWI